MDGNQTASSVNKVGDISSLNIFKTKNETEKTQESLIITGNMFM